ncbi:MAG: hypothetical protein IKP86_13040 [Anaerolineaceae bacterium]|nr:hypothetical protein [Anaerolineaceae bacterium]
MRSVYNPDNSSVKIYPNTAIKIYYKTKQYQPGAVGTRSAWEKFSAPLNGADLDVYWADWRGSFGDQELRAMSMGVFDLCTVRMDWHPEIYRLLQRREVIIIKNASPDAVDNDGCPILSDPDVYSVWGAVDDVRSMHKIMEFKVRRFEAK